MINLYQPNLGDEELAAVREVFDSNWVGSGPRTKAFESEFAAHLGVPADRVSFINSATSGLFLTMELLGLGPGDDVVLPSIGFVADGNAVASTGARPVFCDVDRRTLNPTAEHIDAVVTPATRAVLVLHYGGRPGWVAEIAAYCRERGLILIEDAALSVVSAVDGTACGTFGDIGIWSFDSRKLITTGDGGMLYVRDPELAERALRLAYHGLVDRSAFLTAGKGAHRWWEYDISELGRRLVGNDLTAAIGSVQLRRAPGLIERRRVLTALYDRLLAGVDGVLKPPPLPAGHVSSYYFYWVQMNAQIRDLVAETLLSRGVYTAFRYAPLHHMPIYGVDCHLPATEEIADTTLLLPLHPSLTDADVHTVVDELRSVLALHTRRPVGASSSASPGE